MSAGIRLKNVGILTIFIEFSFNLQIEFSMTITK